MQSKPEKYILCVEIDRLSDDSGVRNHFCVEIDRLSDDSGVRNHLCVEIDRLSDDSGVRNQFHATDCRLLLGRERVLKM